MKYTLSRALNIFLLAGVLLLPTVTLGAEKVVYPDNSKLIPLPKDAYPDFSHSVQSSGIVAPEILEKNPDILITPAPNDAPKEDKKSSVLLWVAIIILILTIGISVVRRYLWKKSITTVNQDVV